MRKTPALKKGTAGLLLVVFLMTWVEGLTFSAVHFFADQHHGHHHESESESEHDHDHDHEIQVMPSTHGTQLRFVHKEHHQDSQNTFSDHQQDTGPFTEGHPLALALALEMKMEMKTEMEEKFELDADHFLTLGDFGSSIPSLIKSTSLSPQTLILLAIITYPPSPSTCIRATPAHTQRDHYNLVQVRTIVILV